MSVCKGEPGVKQNSVKKYRMGSCKMGKYMVHSKEKNIPLLKTRWTGEAARVTAMWYRILEINKEERIC